MPTPTGTHDWREEAIAICADMRRQIERVEQMIRDHANQPEIEQIIWREQWYEVAGGVYL